MMKAPKNLTVSKEVYDKAVAEYAVNKRFWDNPKSISKLIKLDVGCIITVAPPINPYYELRNGESFIEKSASDLEKEKRELLGTAYPVVGFGSRVSEQWRLDENEVYYALLKAGMESHKVFYLNNVKFASFDEFAILGIISKENLNKFSLTFVPPVEDGSND